MTLLEQAQRQKAECDAAHKEHTSTTAMLRRAFPPLPTEGLHSRLWAFQAFTQSRYVTTLLSHTHTEPRYGLTLGDPWLPDGVPVLILDGLPIIATRFGDPSIATLNPTGPHAFGLSPTSIGDEYRALHAAGAPTPREVHSIGDILTATERGEPYMPALDPAFNPSAQHVQQAQRWSKIDQALSVVLHVTAIILSATVAVLIGRSGLYGSSPDDALKLLALLLGAVFAGGALLGTQMVLIQVLSTTRAERRARRLGL